MNLGDTFKPLTVSNQKQKRACFPVSQVEAGDLPQSGNGCHPEVTSGSLGSGINPFCQILESVSLINFLTYKLGCGELTLLHWWHPLSGLLELGFQTDI